MTKLRASDVRWFEAQCLRCRVMSVKEGLGRTLQKCWKVQICSSPIWSCNHRVQVYLPLAHEQYVKVFLS